MNLKLELDVDADVEVQPDAEIVAGVEVEIEVQSDIKIDTEIKSEVEFEVEVLESLAKSEKEVPPELVIIKESSNKVPFIDAEIGESQKKNKNCGPSCKIIAHIVFGKNFDG